MAREKAFICGEVGGVQLAVKYIVTE